MYRKHFTYYKQFKLSARLLLPWCVTERSNVASDSVNTRHIGDVDCCLSVLTALLAVGLFCLVDAVNFHLIILFRCDDFVIFFFFLIMIFFFDVM